jgi:hypothetical protein
MAKVNLFARLLNRKESVFRGKSTTSDWESRYNALREGGIHEAVDAREKGCGSFAGACGCTD